MKIFLLFLWAAFTSIAQIVFALIVVAAILLMIVFAIMKATGRGNPGAWIG